MREEVHRIYLQQISSVTTSSQILTSGSDDNSDDVTTAEVWTHVQLNEFATSRDIVESLRCKFDWTTKRPVSSSFAPLSSPCNLKKVPSEDFGKSSNYGVVSKITSQGLLSQRENVQKDTLVLIVTSHLLPDTFVQFDYSLSGRGFVSQNSDEEYQFYNSYSYDRSHSTDPTYVNLPNTMQELDSNSTNLDPLNPADSATLHLVCPKKSFNMVRTLRPEENPLQVQDACVQRFFKIMMHEVGCNNVIQTDYGPFVFIRWFFIPYEPKLPFPRFIALDGYCTTECGSDSDAMDHAPPYHSNGRSLSFKKNSNNTNEIIPDYQPPLCRQAIRLQRERRLSLLLMKSIRAAATNFLSDDLLKQSASDPFVWKKVLCILTDDRFWWVSRNKRMTCTSSQRTRNPSYRIARCRCISLTGASVLELASPQVPYTFEVSSSGGKVYRFRSNNAIIYLKWFDQLSKRIAFSIANHNIAMADLMIGDETMARVNKKDGFFI